MQNDRKFSAFTKLGVAGILTALAACSPGPVPVSRSPHDPSSPSAPEGSAPAVPTHAATTGAHDHAAHHAKSDSAPTTADAVAYVCPMDPEVTSEAPGTCPKCNMKLVPKK